MRKPWPIPGRPRVVTATIKRQVLRFIDQGKSHGAIEKHFGLSGSSVDRIVAEQSAKHPVNAQDKFELDDDAPCFTPPRSHGDGDDSQESEVEADSADAHGVVASEEMEIRCTQPLCDPLDRGLDQVLAKLGVIDDADPLFAPGQPLDAMGGAWSWLC